MNQASEQSVKSYAHFWCGDLPEQTITTGVGEVAIQVRLSFSNGKILVVKTETLIQHGV